MYKSDMEGFAMKNESNLTAAEAWALGDRRPSQEQAMALWEKAQLPGGPGKAARDALFYLFRPLPEAVVSQRYVKRFSSLFDDLVQEGYMALLEAIDRYDPGRGARFSTFAWTLVDWRLKAAFPRMDCSISLPDGQHRLRRKSVAVRSRLESMLGRTPRLEEIALECGEPVRLIAAVLGVSAVSADETRTCDGGCLLNTFVAQDPLPEEAVESNQLARLALMHVGRLKDSKREVVVRHLGLEGHEPRTLASIAGDRGVTRQATSQLYNQAMADLREAVQG